MAVAKAQIWLAGGGGAAPPLTLLHPGGLCPPDPPKGAPRPWLQRLVALSRPSHLSGAAALPGAELFSRNPIYFEEATCLGQLRCPAQNFFPDMYFFNEITCLGQLRCQGLNFSNEFDFFEELTCLGQLRCLGQNLFSEI